MEHKKTTYMNPYLAGVLLGFVLLAAFYFTGRGLGASGAVKSTIVTVVDAVAPEHAADSHFYEKYTKQEESPLRSWLVFEMLGVLFGALVSGVIAGRLKLKVEHSPKISPKTRLIAAGIGGLLFGLGSQIGRGCTSGAALSGMGVMATSGFISMLTIFGTAYLFAYVFRKLWI